MNYLAIFAASYACGWIIGYFTGHTVALSKVQSTLAKARQRTQVDDLYPKRSNDNNN